MSLRELAAWAIAVTVLLGLLALNFWTFPTSVAGWFALVALGVPVWLLLEWLGEKVLNARFFGKLPSAARVLLGVPVVLALMALATVLVAYVRHLSGS
jgi:hypothetical protein